ncbi:hypothetical protein CAL7102_01576 [Dulcicalothrix desertica PCC 7102]|nr:hypothetical protein CAL7102_01576 [Dulcicalothrix desertica PCC 7102]
MPAPQEALLIKSVSYGRPYTSFSRVMQMLYTL